MMDFLMGSAVQYVLGKAAQKAGEKLLDRSLDRAFDHGEGFVAALYRRIFQREEFSDLLASKERRELALRYLKQMQDTLSAIIGQLDDLYGGYLTRKVTMHRFELADAVAANIEQRQAGFLEILRRANDDFPSLLPLIGYFALAQQSQEELERLVQPDQQQLNESFAFMTFVTRTADSRAGLLFRSRETLQDELRHAQEAISERGVSEQLVLQLRSYERLTNVLLYAISYVEQLLRAEPKTQDLPKSVRVIGKFARAEAAIESAIRDYDAPRAAPLSAEIKEANRLRNESWRALSDAQGGMFDQLEVVDRNADLILAKLGRSRPSI